MQTAANSKSITPYGTHIAVLWVAAAMRQRTPLTRPTAKERAMESLGSATREYHRRPLVGLISDLWRDSATLLRDEAELAKAEISEKVSEVGAGIGSVALAGAVLFGGFLLILFAAVGFIAKGFPDGQAKWLAPLLGGGVFFFICLVILSPRWKKF